MAQILIPGNASPADVLETKKFSAGAYYNAQGTMPDKSGDTAYLSSEVIGTTLKLLASAGSRDGVNDKVTITDADFVAGNISKDKNIFGLIGTLDYVALAAGEDTTLYSYLPEVVQNVDNYLLNNSVLDVVFSQAGSARFRWNIRSNTSSYVRAQLAVNGNLYGTLFETNNPTTPITCTQDVEFSAGDTVSIYVQKQSSSSNYPKTSNIYVKGTYLPNQIQATFHDL